MLHTWVVGKGDSLWSIADVTYGKGSYWNELKKANKSKVHGAQNIIRDGDTLACWGEGNVGQLGNEAVDETELGDAVESLANGVRIHVADEAREVLAVALDRPAVLAPGDDALRQWCGELGPDDLGIEAVAAGVDREAAIDAGHDPLIQQCEPDRPGRIGGQPLNGLSGVPRPAGR